MLELLDHTHLLEILRGEGVAFQLVETADVDHGELFSKEIVESSFGDAADQGHLATFKAAFTAVAAP
jgi:hypothetical protein